MRRRNFLAYLAATGGIKALGLTLSPPAWPAESAMTHARDWAWLQGGWKVRHRRLKQRLVGDHTWEEFAGHSAMWLTMDGLGTIDDNIVELPGDAYRGLGIRAFDAAAGTWSIWWLDGRDPTRIDPPVRGAFQ